MKQRVERAFPAMATAMYETLDFYVTAGTHQQTLDFLACGMPVDKKAVEELVSFCRLLSKKKVQKKTFPLSSLISF